MAKKLNSMRLLDKANVNYEVFEFPSSVHSADGVADHLQVPKSQVYKTLVVEPSGGKPCLVMVAGDRELDLKKLAASLGEKKVSMASQADAERMTRLKVGGISALALLNRGFKIYLDRPALDLDAIIISAGRRGVNLQLPVQDLIDITNAGIVDGT
jgi:Cys-tRNA(Pro)/Cys-tRNA(Cys) deacylase